jgi:excinuclease UvrABC helicase subunit UvrB
MLALYMALLNGFNIDGKRTHIIDETFVQNCNGGYQIEMLEHAKNLEFEQAAAIRDEIARVREGL